MSDPTTPDFYQVLEPLQGLARAGKWEEIHRHFGQVCGELAGEKAAERIAAIAPKKYMEELARTAAEAIRLARENDFSAVVYNYDLDNNWSGDFELCPDYDPDDETGESWASGVQMQAPECGAFGRAWREDFNVSKKDVGVNTFLIARTTALLGEIIEKITSPGIAVLIGYHDGNFYIPLRDREKRIAPPEVHAREAELYAAIRRTEMGGKCALDFTFRDIRDVPPMGLSCLLRRSDGSETLPEEVTNSGGTIYYRGLEAEVPWELTVRDGEQVLLLETFVPQPGPQQFRFQLQAVLRNEVLEEQEARRAWLREKQPKKKKGR